MTKIIKRSGWFFNSRLYLSVKLSTELWYVTMKNGDKKVYLFNFGWYKSKSDTKQKLFSLVLFNISFQFAWVKYDDL